MVFSGISFLFYFLPLFLFIYFLCPAKYRNGVLLLGSIFFYQWGVPWFTAMLLLSTWLSFQLVRKMDSAFDPQVRKRWLVLSLLLNLGVLAWFKYANFFADNIIQLQRIFGLSTVHWTEVLLPVGISFFTFQSITYSVDVYRRQHPPLQKASDYLMYILMFPQLVAGPIVRFHEIADSISGRKHTRSRISWGLVRFSTGLAKKVLIANSLGVVADEVFRMQPAAMSSGDAWIGMMAYTFQIYYDFSGYSDMAIGLGLILGFRFPENFDNPYISRNITEFWRRWHITLGNFMKNYLYIPLGGNRSGKLATYRNLMLVFMLSGLWHGADWTFIAWGVYHGIFLLIDRIWLLKRSEVWNPFAQIIITFLVTMFGWVLFKSADMSRAVQFYASLFNPSRINSLYLSDTLLISTLIIAAFFAWITLAKRGRKWAGIFYPSQYDKQPPLFAKSVALVLLLFSLWGLITGDFNPFIYFRF